MAAQTINQGRASDPPRAAIGRWRVWAPRIALLTSAILAAAMIAACGGGSSGGGTVASGGTQTTAQNTDHFGKPSPLAFARCMRKHGLPDFPDPTSSGQLQLPAGMTTSSPAYKRAAKHCGYLIGGKTAPQPLTQNPQTQTAALKLARCMRSHGVPNFPDGPISKSSGINENTPAFQRAFRKCSSNLTGSSQVPVTAG